MRADGSDKKSPTCDWSVLGLIVVGPDYGHTYQVCVNKDCAIHWREEQRAKAREATSAGAGGAPRGGLTMEAIASWSPEEYSRQWAKNSEAILRVMRGGE